MDATATPAAARRLPPVTQIAIATMALIVVGGITMASRLPSPPLPLLIGLLAAATVLLGANLVLLSRLRDFAWRQFFTVARWTALAYLVMYGMLEFTFIYDKVPGSTLTVLTLMLLVIAIDVPMLFGFTVARYADPD
jgi:hypothetical protein